MSDYISREELLKAVDTWDKFGCDANTKLVPIKDCYVPYVHYDDIIHSIKAMPSADVRENIHGEWMPITQPWLDTQIYRCPCCGRHIEVPQYEVSTLTIRYPFCHCGADMRGE